MKTKVDLSVNKRVQEVMEQKQIDNHMLASLTGLNYNTVRGYTTSGSPIKFPKLQIIAKALDVPTSFLLGEETSLEKENLRKAVAEMQKVLDIMSKILEGN